MKMNVNKQGLKENKLVLYFRKNMKLFRVTTCLLFLLVPQISTAYELEIFGTITTELESVSPNTKTDEGYTTVRDAYTRIAFKLGHELSSELDVFALVEVPFDTAKMELNNGFDQHKDVFDSTERLAFIQLNSSKYGAILAGRLWEPYHNSVSASVNRFSSYYAGFATYSVLRVEQALVYSSPDFNGLSFSLMHAHKNGNKQSNGKYDDRNQLTFSYMVDDTKFGFGYSDSGGIQNQKLYGVSLSHTVQDFYMAAKYERQHSDISNKHSFGHDGDEALNLYLEYNWGLHTFKSHIAKVDNFGGDIFHFAYDYQLNEHIKLFTEYYQEQTGAAITSKQGGFRDTYWAEGGRAVLFGLSFTFSKQAF